MAAYPYRTVVDAPGLTHALVEATTVFAEIGVTSPTSAQTTQMEGIILQVSSLIDSYLDRVLAEEDVTDHFRDVTGDTLRLSRWPVAQILQVMESGTEVASDGWEVNESTGELWRLSSSDRYDWTSPGTITVSYVGGYILPDSLPADIQRAAIEQIKFHYFGSDRDPALRSLDVPGIASESYAVAGGSSMGSSALLSTVRGAIERYARKTV